MARSNYGALDELTHDMERVFDSLLGRTVGTVLRSGSNDKFTPMLDVSESASEFDVLIDLPGVKPEDVKVEVHDGKLVVSGERQSRLEEKDKNFHRVERFNGSFFRSVALPSEVDVDKIDASYDQGVLRITLPKLAKQQPKKIQIRRGGQ